MSELSSSVRRVSAQPRPFEFDVARTALVMIDMQRDFVEPGGFGESLGNDVSRLAAVVPPALELLGWARSRGLLVVHTREAHRADLSDCPPAKRLRGAPSMRIGDPGPMGRILIDGEPGAGFVDGLEPLAGEIEIVKPGKGAFYNTTLTHSLLSRRITHLIFGGVTTEVCVQTTMREANDRGFECLVLADCCGATDLGNHEAALKMVTMQGGVFGAVGRSTQVLASLGRA